MKKGMTISQIASHNVRAGRKTGVAYFSKDNMKMFEDKLCNYKIVSESPTGCVLERKGKDYQLFYDKRSGSVTRM